LRRKTLEKMEVISRVFLRLYMKDNPKDF
jgi:hypothetical protein